MDKLSLSGSVCSLCRCDAFCREYLYNFVYCRRCHCRLVSLESRSDNTRIYCVCRASHSSRAYTRSGSSRDSRCSLHFFSSLEKRYAKYLFKKKNTKIAFEQTKRKIENYEQELKNELDKAWQEALGIQYDGVALTPALAEYQFDYVEGTVGIK